MSAKSLPPNIHETFNEEMDLAEELISRIKLHSPKRAERMNRLLITSIDAPHVYAQSDRLGKVIAHYLRLVTRRGW